MNMMILIALKTTTFFNFSWGKREGPFVYLRIIKYLRKRKKMKNKYNKGMIVFSIFWGTKNTTKLAQKDHEAKKSRFELNLEKNTYYRDHFIVLLKINYLIEF